MVGVCGGGGGGGGAHLYEVLRQSSLMMSQSARARQEAPCFTNCSTTSKWPQAAAECTAIQDLLFLMCGSAPASSNASTTSACPAPASASLQLPACSTGGSLAAMTDGLTAHAGSSTFACAATASASLLTARNAPPSLIHLLHHPPDYRHKTEDSRIHGEAQRPGARPWVAVTGSTMIPIRFQQSHNDRALHLWRLPHGARCFRWSSGCQGRRQH